MSDAAGQKTGPPNVDAIVANRKAVLDYVKATYDETGVPPTVRAISKTVGIEVSGVHGHLRQLVRSGLLVHRARKYLPADREAVLDTTRPVECPFDGPAHDYAESFATMRVFCRKCGDQLVLGSSLAEIAA